MVLPFLSLTCHASYTCNITLCQACTDVMPPHLYPRVAALLLPGMRCTPSALGVSRQCAQSTRECAIPPLQVVHPSSAPSTSACTPPLPSTDHASVCDLLPLAVEGLLPQRHRAAAVRHRQHAARQRPAHPPYRRLRPPQAQRQSCCLVSLGGSAPGRCCSVLLFWPMQCYYANQVPASAISSTSVLPLGTSAPGSCCSGPRGVTRPGTARGRDRARRRSGLSPPSQMRRRRLSRAPAEQHSAAGRQQGRRVGLRHLEVLQQRALPAAARPLRPDEHAAVLARARERAGRQAQVGRPGHVAHPVAVPRQRRAVLLPAAALAVPPHLRRAAHARRRGRRQPAWGSPALGRAGRARWRASRRSRGSRPGSGAPACTSGRGRRDCEEACDWPETYSHSLSQIAWHSAAGAAAASGCLGRRWQGRA